MSGRPATTAASPARRHQPAKYKSHPSHCSHPPKTPITTKMKKLFIETYGCQMNVADSEVVASVMKMAGYELCESVDEADAVFLNTCSVRDNAEQKVLNRLDTLHAMTRKGRRMIIGVLGCMAERVKEDLLENHHADLVAGPDAYLTLPDLIAQAETGHKAMNIELSTTCLLYTSDAADE